MSAQLESIAFEEITGLILAGGRGSRMGGADKGLVPFAGTALVEHVIAALKPQCARLMLSVNRNEETYARYGLPMVTDGNQNFSGPLAGIAAALEKTTTDYLVVAPCDSPFLPSDYVARLAAGLASHPQAKVAAARTAGREQAVFMLIRQEAVTDVKAALASGQLAVHRWLNETMHAVWVDFDDAHAFENMNLPEDLRGGTRKNIIS